MRRVNCLHAKFFRGNKNIYLQFISFLHIAMTQVVEILPQVRQELIYSTQSIHVSWVLMFWWHKEPGHQQPWYSKPVCWTRLSAPGPMFAVCVISLGGFSIRKITLSFSPLTMLTVLLLCCVLPRWRYVGACFNPNPYLANVEFVLRIIKHFYIFYHNSISTYKWHWQLKIIHLGREKQILFCICLGNDFVPWGNKT